MAISLELLLNIVWLAISAAIVGFFGQRLFARGNREQRALGLMALVCVICLLFPVVSMTDDLNSDTTMLEPGKVRNLLPSIHLVISLLPPVLTYSAPELVWTRLAFERDQKPNQQDSLSFNLSRRPPPYRVSL